jgi:hypothetical protein
MVYVFFLPELSIFTFFLLFRPRFHNGLFRNSLTLLFLDFITEKNTFPRQLKTTRTPQNGKEKKPKENKTAKKNSTKKKIT